MTAAAKRTDLHELVDQLNPAQADAVHAVIVQLVKPRGTDLVDGRVKTQRHLSFAGTLSAEPELAQRSDEILQDIVARHPE